MPATNEAALPSPAIRVIHGPAARYLYLGVAAFLTTVVFLAFTRTYWAPMAAGALRVHPAIHVHAVLFFLWMLFLVAQTALVANRRAALHRALGLFGIALATAMVFSGVLASIVTLAANLDSRPDIARRSAVLSASGMTLFSTFIVLGIASIKRPEIHRRLMVLATFSILQAAIARVIMLFPSIQQPARMTMGAVIVDFLLLAVALADARGRGRIHPVYLMGGAFIVLVQIGRALLVRTEAWVSFTNWVATLAA